MRLLNITPKAHAQFVEGLQKTMNEKHQNILQAQIDESNHQLTSLLTSLRNRFVGLSVTWIGPKNHGVVLEVRINHKFQKIKIELYVNPIRKDVDKFTSYGYWLELHASIPFDGNSYSEDKIREMRRTWQTK